ncbi:MAG: hypothetical protein HY959_03725 [Ignavibacteriae bacterium]|nr:hypothetical protein [Ignavibacteriota bacterium]
MEKKYVSWAVFIWAIGIIFIVLSVVFAAQASINTKLDNYQVENQKIQSQLSQIQTDLSWIKLQLQK